MSGGQPCLIRPDLSPCPIPSRERVQFLIAGSHALNKGIQLSLILPLMVPLPRIVCPADHSTPAIFLNDREHIYRIIDVRLFDFVRGTTEGLEADNVATLLEVQKDVFQVVVELGRECLVVDQDDVRSFESLTHLFVLEKVIMNEMDAARLDAPELTTSPELLCLELRQLVRIFLEFATP